MKEREQYWSIKLRRVGEALKRNGIESFVIETREEALNRALGLIPKGATVGLGGSRTVREVGLLAALRDGDYTLYDQYRDGISREESMRIRKAGTHADCFVSGSNAITRDGKIVNVDGLGNRLAGFCFGPGKVIIVAGRNKIVPDLEAALDRVRNVAAPMNARRFGAKTPCVETAECSDCDSPERICNLTLIIEKSRIEGRMNVLLVNEELGF
jgi:L-lactate utilization protein LutB